MYLGLNKKYCYSFVITHPENKIVAQYKECKLYLTLIRNMETYELVNDKPLNLGVNYPKKYGYLSYEILEAHIKSLPFYKEGYMLYSMDRKYRTKLKALWERPQLELQNEPPLHLSLPLSNFMTSLIQT